MFEKQRAEKNFIQKKREWTGNLDKPMGRRALLMMLPALVVGVFLLISAPYIKIIMEKILTEDTTLDLRALNIEDEPEAKKPKEELSPPSPESQMALYYQDLYDKEGFDWRSAPKAPEVDMELVKEAPIKISPVEVDLPVTMSDLAAKGE